MELGDQGTKVDEGGRRSWSGGDDDKRPQADSGSGSDDDEGTRQPYNCTFCRRGFPTAQALGGHMNVHRKDRPGIRASTAPAARTTPIVDALMGYGLADPAPGGSLLHAAERAPVLELRLFGRVVDGAGAGRGKEHGGAYRDRRDQYYGAKDGRVGDHSEQEEELDLELRLGAAGQ